MNKKFVNHSVTKFTVDCGHAVRHKRLHCGSVLAFCLLVFHDCSATTILAPSAFFTSNVISTFSPKQNIPSLNQPPRHIHPQSLVSLTTMSSASTRNASPAPGTTAQVVTELAPARQRNPLNAGTLVLRGEPSDGSRRIRWAEDVVDNEGMGKKSSKGRLGAPAISHGANGYEPLGSLIRFLRDKLI
jgi:hypothetical protein